MIFSNAKDFLSFISQINGNKFKLMGLDVGAKKIGVAILYNEVRVATPLTTYLRVGKKKDIPYFVALIAKNLINGLVIGLPISSQSDNLEEIQKFAARLNEASKLPILLLDERLTTKLANTMLKDIGVNRKKRNQVDDQVVACILLEDLITISNRTSPKAR